MCTSTATLLYGLWVTTASLAFAATAHHRTRSPFFAIDLILLRRRSGSLKVGREKDSAFAMMPPEVWENIKQKIIYIEVRSAELQEINKYRCEQCLKEDWLRSLLAQATVGLKRHGAQAEEFKVGCQHEWDEWGPPPNDCDLCWENVYEGMIDLLGRKNVKRIKNLLGPYGLSMPSNQVWNSEPAAEYHDFDSLSPISLSLRGSNTLAFPEVEAEADHNYEYSSSHAVANISPAIFALPPDIHLRFASLVQTFGLQVVERSTFEILPSNPPPPKAEAPDDKLEAGEAEGAGSTKGKEKEKKPAKELKFGRFEPRWMLWSAGYPCS